MNQGVLKEDIENDKKILSDDIMPPLVHCDNCHKIYPCIHVVDRPLCLDCINRLYKRYLFYG